MFDAPKHCLPNGAPAPYEERVRHIASVVGPGKTQYARAVGVRKCTGQAQLDSFLRDVEAHEGEGLMLRQPGSLYEWKRSKTLLKVKTFSDEEAEVVGHEKGSRPAGLATPSSVSAIASPAQTNVRR